MSPKKLSIKTKKSSSPLFCQETKTKDGKGFFHFPLLDIVGFHCLEAPLNTPENIQIIGDFFIKNAFMIHSRKVILCADIDKDKIK